jgi:hypothetical protein
MEVIESIKVSLCKYSQVLCKYVKWKVLMPLLMPCCARFSCTDTSNTGIDFFFVIGNAL